MVFTLFMLVSVIFF